MALHTLVISGSNRADSRTAAVASLLRDRLESTGTSVTHWNLGSKPLPMMDPFQRDHPESISDAHLKAFRTEASKSDALVLCSPVYHDSYSGLLKNALDHLSTRDLADKAFGLVSHGGRRTTQAVSHLRTIVRSFNGMAISTQVCTEDSDLLFDGGGQPIGVVPLIEERMFRFCDELATFALVLSHVRQGTLLQSLSMCLATAERMAEGND